MTKRARTDHAKDQRRNALLEAALEEFFASGFRATRMDDIAKRAGLSKGTVYLYFESKEDLFVELVETIALPNVERIEAIVDSTKDANAALRALLSMAPTMVCQSSLPKVMKVLIGDAGFFPEVVQGYRTRVLERVLSALERLLERGHAAGDLVVHDPGSTARLVVAPIFFSALWRVVFETGNDDRIDLDALFHQHTETLLRGLSPLRAGVEGAAS